MMPESWPSTQTNQPAQSLTQIAEQQLANVRYAPLATKILRCRECSDVPLASFAATQKIESLFVISDSNDTSNPIITLENRSNIVSPRINPVELLFFDRADRFD